MKSINTGLIVALTLMAAMPVPAGAQESAASLDARLAQAVGDDPQAQFVLGSMYYKGSSGARRDHAMAAYWYRKAAEQGHVKAQVNLASLYVDGEGVTQDYAEAARWYRKAAEDGAAALAEFNLGVMYAKGRGVAPDPAEAAHWYRRAAEQGFAPAQMQIAFMYYLGKGLPKDKALAREWMEKAAIELPEARQHLDRLNSE